jgi:hypothetical protein
MATEETWRYVLYNTSISMAAGKIKVITLATPFLRVFARRTPAKISYMFVQKRLERLGVVDRGAFGAVRFKKLEEQMFGVPFWRSKARRRPMGI